MKKKFMKVCLFLIVSLSFVFLLKLTESFSTVDKYQLNETILNVTFLNKINLTQEITYELPENIPVIIEFEDEPLIPYEKNVKDEDKIKSHSEKIDKVQKETIKVLEKDFGVEKIKRQHKHIINAVMVTIKSEDLEEIENLPEVKKVWLDENMTILLQDSVPLINADDVWKEQNSTGSNITGKDVIVAIIDTGIDYTHDDLGNCTSSEFLAGTCSRVIYGYDFYNEDNNPMDDHGHGTHCAGIVGANGTKIGVAPDVKFLAYKVCSSGGSCPSSDILSGIENATLYGADIISISLTMGKYANVVFTKPIDSAVANGTIVVVAAGNNGPASNTLTCGILSAIVVGATDKYDNLASFTSHGFSFYSNGTIAGIKPDVVAPGVDIESSWLDDTINTLSGTSMATPHISGTAALIKQAHPTWSVEDIKYTIANNAKDIGHGALAQGNGRVNSFLAYNTSSVVTNNMWIGEDDGLDNETWVFIKSFNLTNLVNKTIDHTILYDFSQTGITVSLSHTNISLAENQSVLFNLTISINNPIAENIKEHWGEVIINTTQGQNFTSPISVRVFYYSANCSDTIIITNSTTLPQQNCYVKDTTNDGIIIINGSNLFLDCSNSIFDGMVGSGTFIWHNGSSHTNVTIQNCTIKNYERGIYGLVTNATYKNNTIQACAVCSVCIRANNITTKGNTLEASQYAFFTATENLKDFIIEDNDISGGTYAIYLEQAKSFIIRNNLIGTLYFNHGGGDVRIENNYVGSFGLYANNYTNTNISSNNVSSVILMGTSGTVSAEFKDGWIRGSGTKIDLWDGILNLTDTVWESEGVNWWAGTMAIYRKWYISVNVTDSNFNPLNSVNVSVKESASGGIEWIGSTDSMGIIRKASTEYTRNRSQYYFTPHNVTISKKNYGSNSTTVNLTETNSITVYFTLQEVGEPPMITVNSPVNNTNYTISWIWGNVSLDEGGSWCGYSLNSTVNVTMSNDTTIHWYYNISGLGDTNYNITFFCNDTTSNMSSSNTIYFTVNASDYYPPKYFNNSTNSTIAGTSILFSLRWTDNFELGGYIFSLDNATGNFVNYSWVAFSASVVEDWSNVTKTINTSVGKIIRWKVYANDTSNNWNESLEYSFNTTNEFSVITISSPIINSYHKVNWIELNYTPTDDSDTSMECWYFLNSTETISPNSPITNNTKDSINITSLSEGLYLLNVKCQDEIPQNGTSSTINFTIDTINPLVTNPDPASGNFTKNTLQDFTVNVSDVNLNRSSGKLYWKYPSSALEYTEENMSCIVDLCFYDDLNISLISSGEYLSYYFEINDTARNTGNNGTSLSPLILYIDREGPNWRNLGQNATNIQQNQSVKLYVEVKDEYINKTDWAWLSTDETGSWKNKTTYSSPKDMGNAGVWTWANFTWNNTTISTGTIQWKIYANDTLGNENVTDVESFTIGVVTTTVPVSGGGGPTETTITTTTIPIEPIIEKLKEEFYTDPKILLMAVTFVSLMILRIKEKPDAEMKTIEELKKRKALLQRRIDSGAYESMHYKWRREIENINRRLDRIRKKYR